MFHSCLDKLLKALKEEKIQCMKARQKLKK